MNVVKPLVSASQVLLSACGLYLSYTSITNVRVYEEQTKTAAQYSGAAELQLRKTRTTLASGTLTLLFSLGTALGVLSAPGFLNNTLARSSLSVVNCGAALSAGIHIRRWWRGKAKVPLMDSYNRAISSTIAISRILLFLAGTWAVDVLLEFVG